mmetsp:Transcript_68993/g.183832  ORF Transcript_68993/g.183832 Transcript_68993/m.183832 type:complete len:244 (-) Transcript_68993:1308-2039(-)
MVLLLLLLPPRRRFLLMWASTSVPGAAVAARDARRPAVGSTQGSASAKNCRSKVTCGPYLPRPRSRSWLLRCRVTSDCLGLLGQGATEQTPASSRKELCSQQEKSTDSLPVPSLGYPTASNFSSPAIGIARHSHSKTLVSKSGPTRPSKSSCTRLAWLVSEESKQESSIPKTSSSTPSASSSKMAARSNLFLRCIGSSGSSKGRTLPMACDTELRRRGAYMESPLSISGGASVRAAAASQFTR